MANIWQVTWRWTGFAGAPGYTNLFYDGSLGTAAAALAAATKSRLLFDGVKTLVPAVVHFQLVTDVRLLDDVSGDLQNIFTVSGVTDVVGTAGAGYSAPAGMCIDWPTVTIHGTRRLQGRTFLVPLANYADPDGTPAASAITTVATAAEAMRTATGPTFGVWGRPRAAQPLHVPPITARDGLWGPATSSRVPDKVVVLRSRRD